MSEKSLHQLKAKLDTVIHLALSCRGLNKELDYCASHRWPPSPTETVLLRHLKTASLDELSFTALGKSTHLQLTGPRFWVRVAPVDRRLLTWSFNTPPSVSAKLSLPPANHLSCNTSRLIPPASTPLPVVSLHYFSSMCAASICLGGLLMGKY